MATVTGSIRNLAGALTAGAKISFTYLSAPSNTRGSLLKSNTITVDADSNGEFSTLLAGGQYDVQIVGGIGDKWRISVDDSNNSFDILSLLAHGQNRYDAALAIGNAGTSRAGIVRVATNVEPSPVVYTKAQVDALFTALRAELHI